MDYRLLSSDVEPQKHTNEELYYKQMEMLKGFLERGAISQAQYNKSTGDLTRLMGYTDDGKAQNK